MYNLTVCSVTIYETKQTQFNI